MEMMAKALQKALERHNKKYPGADAFSAHVWKSTAFEGFRVEIVAAHFSMPLCYDIRMTELAS